MSLILFTFNRVMALDCRMLFSLSILRMKLCILMKFCLCTKIYKILVRSDNELDFITFYRVMALDCRMLFSLSILRMKLCILMKFCLCTEIYKILLRTDNELDFINFQQSYGP